MTRKKHWAVFITNQSNKQGFIDHLMGRASGLPAGFEVLRGKKGALFSKLEVDKFIEEEVRHDKKILTSGNGNSPWELLRLFSTTSSSYLEYFH